MLYGRRDVPLLLVVALCLGLGGAVASGAGAPAGGQAVAAGRQVGAAEPMGEITAGKAGSREVRITKGRIEVGRFLEALSQLSGLPVIYDAVGSESYFRGKSLVVPSDIDANARTIKAILAVNGYLCRARQASGVDILEVVYARAPARENGLIRRTYPLLDLEPDPEREKDLDPFEIVTLVAPLRHVDTEEALSALKSLYRADAAPSPPAAGDATETGEAGQAASPPKAPDAPGAEAFEAMARVPSANTLIINTAYEEVERLRGLIRRLDAGVDEPEWIIEIIDVKGSSASDLVGRVESVLKIQTESAAATARTSGSRTPTTTLRRAPSPPSSRTTSSKTETSPSPGPLTARFVSLNDVGRIVIVAPNEGELERARALIAHLDYEREEPEPDEPEEVKLHVFPLEHIDADRALEIVSTLCPGSSTTSAPKTTRVVSTRPRTTPTRTATRPPTPSPPSSSSPRRLVAHTPTNSLLFRGTEEERKEIAEILEQIDKQAFEP